MITNLQYLHDLVTQLEELGVLETDSLDIRAVEGQPAIVTVESGCILAILVQDAELKKLEVKVKISL